MGKRVFTNSEFSCFQDCPQKWWFKYDQKLEPVRTKMALFFGDIFHKSLDIFYMKKSIKMASAFAADAYDEVIKTIEDAEEQQEMLSACDLTLQMLSRYSEFSEQNDDFEIVEVETPHQVAIVAPSGRKSSQFEYNFRLDQLVKRGDKYWIHEFKTAKRIDRDYLENLMLDEQMTRYMWGIEKAKGITIEGAIYTMMLKAVPKPPAVLKNGKLSTAKNQSTTHELYLEAIEKLGLNKSDYFEILDFLEKKGDKYIQRELVLRNEKEKKQCEARMWTLAKTLNTDAPIYKCPGRDCSWKCDFRALCIEDSPEARSVYNTRKSYHPEMEGGETNNEDNK